MYVTSPSYISASFWHATTAESKLWLSIFAGFIIQSFWQIYLESKGESSRENNIMQWAPLIGWSGNSDTGSKQLTKSQWMTENTSIHP